MNSVNSISYQIIDPLYEPIDMSTDKELAEKLSPLFLKLLNTYELRHARWISQSGLLFEIFPGATHTRRAHAIGCWCVGWYALEDVKVSTLKGNIPLKEWLKKKDLLEEFMAALLLHDIGHPPFSHALEFSPDETMKLDHKAITESLITGEPDRNGINWEKILTYELCRFGTRGKKGVSKDEYKKYWEDAEKEVLTVKKVLDDTLQHKENAKRIISDIINGQKDKKDENNDLICALHALVDSQIDLDRMDHYPRDSYFSGVRVAEFNPRHLLQNMIIVIKSANPTRFSEMSSKMNNTNEHAYIVCRKNGLHHANYIPFMKDSLNELAFWHNENLRLIGTLNQAVRILVGIDRSLKLKLPIFTDLTLLQYLKHQDFLGTTIEGYGRVLRGEIPLMSYNCYSYSKNLSTEEKNELYANIYENAEKFNERKPRNPGILIFVGRSHEAENGCCAIVDEGSLERGERNCRICENRLFNIFRNKAEDREKKILIWSTENKKETSDTLGLDGGYLKCINIKMKKQ